MVLTIDRALEEIFTESTETLALRIGVNYNTVASWKFNYRNNAMSTEKKTEILEKLNYKLIEQSKWKKQAK
jgi:hypothetical protein